MEYGILPQERTVRYNDPDIPAYDDVILEDELVERAKSEPEAFTVLYDLYYSRILNYLFRRVYDVDIAEELTSGTFFSILKALPKYRKKSSFRSWIYHIATNEMNMYLRSRKNRTSRERNFHTANDLDRVYFPVSDLDILEDEWGKMLLYRKLHTSLEKLPEKYRTVIVLKYIENLRYDEIARVTGKRTGTVKSLVHRGLKSLRGIMESETQRLSDRCISMDERGRALHD